MALPSSADSVNQYRAPFGTQVLEMRGSGWDFREVAAGRDRIGAGREPVRTGPAAGRSGHSSMDLEVREDAAAELLNIPEVIADHRMHQPDRDAQVSVDYDVSHREGPAEAIAEGG